MLALWNDKFLAHENERVKPQEGRFIDFHNNHVVFCVFAMDYMVDFFRSLEDYVQGVCVIHRFKQGRFVNISFLKLNVLVMCDPTLKNTIFRKFLESLLLKVKVIPVSDDDYRWISGFQIKRPNHLICDYSYYCEVRDRFNTLAARLSENQYLERVKRSVPDWPESGNEIDLRSLACAAYSCVLIHLLESRIYGYREYISALEVEKKKLEKNGRKVFKESDFIIFEKKRDRVKGSYGTFCMCMSLETHNIYGIKRSLNPCWVGVLKREFEVLSQISHPAINFAFGCVQYDTPDKYGIILEYGVYGSLSNFKERLLPERMVNINCETRIEDYIWRTAMIVDISAAVSYLHRMGFLHRDIKSDNIVVGYGFRAMLCDFSSCVLWKEGSVAIERNITRSLWPEETDANKEYTFSSESDVLRRVKEYIEAGDDGQKICYDDLGWGWYEDEDPCETTVDRVKRLRFIRTRPVFLFLQNLSLLLHLGARIISHESLSQRLEYLRIYVNMKEHGDLDFYTCELNALVNEMESLMFGTPIAKHMEIVDIFMAAKTFWDVLLESLPLYKECMEKVFNILIKLRENLVCAQVLSIERADGIDSSSIDVENEPEWLPSSNFVNDNDVDRTELCLAYYLVHFRNLKNHWKNDKELCALDEYLAKRISKIFIPVVAMWNFKNGQQFRIMFEFAKYLCKSKDEEMIEIGNSILIQAGTLGVIPAIHYRAQHKKKQNDYAAALDILWSAVGTNEHFALNQISLMRHFERNLPNELKQRIDEWYTTCKARHIFDNVYDFYTGYGLRSWILYHSPVRDEYINPMRLQSLCDRAHMLPCVLPFFMDLILTQYRLYYREVRLGYNEAAEHIEILVELWMLLLKVPVPRDKVVSIRARHFYKELYREARSRNWIVTDQDGTETVRCPRL